MGRWLFVLIGRVQGPGVLVGLRVRQSWRLEILV